MFRISFASYGNLSVPENAERFVEFWRRSDFIKCIGLEVERKTTKPYLPTEKTLKAMQSLIEYLISFDVYPFIFCGTLLGWFRECGIIPHTTDVDFAAFIEEYKPALLEELRSNRSKLFLKRILGKPSDSFEFTFQALDKGRPNIDLFWLYTSKNESWVGGSKPDGTKYKYSYYRIKKICACDLLGHMFWVPCDPLAIVTNEYGPKWYLDSPTKRYVWFKSQYNVRENGKFNKTELKHVYQVFE